MMQDVINWTGGRERGRERERTGVVVPHEEVDEDGEHFADVAND